MERADLVEDFVRYLTPLTDPSSFVENFGRLTGAMHSGGHAQLHLVLERFSVKAWLALAPQPLAVRCVCAWSCFFLSLSLPVLRCFYPSHFSPAFICPRLARFLHLSVVSTHLT